MNWRKIFYNDMLAGCLLFIIFTVGVAGHIYPQTFSMMINLTPWVLFILGAIVFLQMYKKGNPGILLWAVLTYFFTFGLEALGVATGLIFGSYIYGETLGFMISGVPIVIGFNWMIILLGLSAVVFRYVHKPFGGALSVAIGATFFDWVMEPAAIALDYWQWSRGDIPIQNYMAWFIIAFICAYGFGYFRLKSGSKLGFYYVGIQLLFFMALRMASITITA